MPLKSKHTTRAYPSIQPAWLLISEQKTRRLSSHAIWRDGPTGKSPPRALFHSVPSLPVTCRTQYVINTLSCCSSVTILMAAHSGSLGHLLCLNSIRKEVVLFFYISKCMKTGEAAQTLLYIQFCTVLIQPSVLFDFNNCTVLYWIPTKYENPFFDTIPNTDH